MNFRNPIMSAAREDIFFRELSQDGNISRASVVAGLNRRDAYVRRKEDKAFGERWDEAFEVAADRLEAEAHRRAVDGTNEPVIYQGTPSYLYRLDEAGRPLLGEDGRPILELDDNGRPKVLSIKRYSDSLLSQMLKAKRKEYRDSSKLELTGAEGGPLQIEETPTQIARRIAFALALGLRAAKESASAPDDGSDLA